MTVEDVEGNPIEGARVNALACGYRSRAIDEADADALESRESDLIGEGEVTAAYCQWGAGTFTEADGLADLGAPRTRRAGTVDVASGAGWYDTIEPGDANELPYPDGVDPFSAERIGAYRDDGTSGTQLLLLARYVGRNEEWFGARRVPAVAALGRSSDGGITVRLDRKLLWGANR